MASVTNFPDSEFTRVSARVIKPSEWTYVERLRVPLDMARRNFGWPITISSYVRVVRTVESDVHTLGQAVDFHPSRGELSAKEYAQRMEDLFNWLATHPAKDELYGTLIHERNHLHMTTVGSQGGRKGWVYREPQEGVFVAVRYYAPLLASVALLALGAAMLYRAAHA